MPPGTTATAFSRASCSGARSSRYPPFSHLIRIVCAASESALARAAAIAITEGLKASSLAGSVGVPGMAGDALGASILGPAALFRLRGQERQVLVVKAAERRPTVRAVGEAVRYVAGGSRAQGRELQRGRRSAVGGTRSHSQTHKLSHTMHAQENTVKESTPQGLASAHPDEDDVEVTDRRSASEQDAPAVEELDARDACQTRRGA